MATEAPTSVTSSWMQRNNDLYVSASQAPFILSIRDGTLDHRFYTRWLGQDYLFVKEFCRFAASVVVKAPEAISDVDLDILLGGLSALQEELCWFRSQSIQWNTKFDGLSKHETTKSYISHPVVCKYPQQPDVSLHLGEVASAFQAINQRVCPTLRVSQLLNPYLQLRLDLRPRKWTVVYPSAISMCSEESFLKLLSRPLVEYPVAVATFWAIEMVYNASFATCLEPDANTPPEMLEACQRWGSKGFKAYCTSLKQLADRALANASPDMLQKAEGLFREVLKHEVAFWSMNFDIDGGPRT